MKQEMFEATALKIEDKKIKQDLKIDIVSAKTIEALLKFLGIEPDEHRYLLDAKLNQHRIEIQGQKPTKIKKTQVPNSKNFKNIKVIELENIREGVVGLNKEDGNKNRNENEEGVNEGGFNDEEEVLNANETQNDNE